MDYLAQLESRSIYIIREAYSLFPKIALLWSIGKDSTSLLWITRKAFFGKIPFPVIHIDTSYKFERKGAPGRCFPGEGKTEML